jgi:hypothetical protein
MIYIIYGICAPLLSRDICTVFLRELILPPVELLFLGPGYPVAISQVYIRIIEAKPLLLTRAGRVSIAVKKFEHYSNWVVCPFCATGLQVVPT